MFFDVERAPWSLCHRDCLVNGAWYNKVRRFLNCCNVNINKCGCPNFFTEAGEVCILKGFPAVI